MTEEIIIDGVNVAGCEYFDRDSSLNNCLAHCIPYPECTCYESCDEHPNCYYKQLKRLKQENKELKEEIRFHNKENSNLLAERNAAQIVYDEIREVRERYRSALEEISGLASPHCTQCSQIINIINEVLK